MLSAECSQTTLWVHFFLQLTDRIVEEPLFSGKWILSYNWHFQIVHMKLIDKSTLQEKILRGVFLWSDNFKRNANYIKLKLICEKFNDKIVFLIIRIVNLIEGVRNLINEEKLEELMQLYTQDLLRISYYYTKSIHTAQDIVQEVFIRFYNKKVNLVNQDIKPYLMRMVINQSKDYLKSWNYRKTQLVAMFPVNQFGKEKNQLIQQEEEDEIAKAIFSLPIKQREAITYYYFEGLTTKEIASLLKVPESTIKSRLSKGCILLKEILHSIHWEVFLHD